jgi:hypothetical protein
MSVRTLNRPESQSLGANGRDDGAQVSPFPILLSYEMINILLGIVCVHFFLCNFVFDWILFRVKVKHSFITCFIEINIGALDVRSNYAFERE